MWITGGEHELSENIVHLVLAKLPDAPEGVKGYLTLLGSEIPEGEWSREQHQACRLES